MLIVDTNKMFEKVLSRYPCPAQLVKLPFHSTSKCPPEDFLQNINVLLDVLVFCCVEQNTQFPQHIKLSVRQVGGIGPFRLTVPDFCGKLALEHFTAPTTFGMSRETISPF